MGHEDGAEHVAQPKGTNMAQDTPEGHAPQGHQPPDAPTDEQQIREQFFEALASSQYRIVDLGGISDLAADRSQLLTDTDVDAMTSAHALRNAQGAQAALSNEMVSNQLTRSSVFYKYLFDGWLALYDRLKSIEAEKALENWGSKPEEELTFSVATLEKAKSALYALGFSTQTVTDAISGMQSVGILFRERVQVNQEPTASERHSFTTQEEFDRPE